ncbi:MAG: hypothetical protein AB9869_09090 [Verrucomicrobiia bacterium]
MASTLVRIRSVIPDQVFSGIGDVLGDFGQETQGIEYLEVAVGVGGQLLLARFGCSVRIA